MAHPVMTMTLKIYPAIAFSVLLSTAATSAATEDGSLACRLVDQSLIERLSGEAVRILKPEEKFVCAGKCPSVNASLCEISLLHDDTSNNTWTLWVYQPPFVRNDWIAEALDDQALTEFVDWKDARAVWEYRAAQQRGYLTIWTNDHHVMIIVTQEHDARSSEQSLSAARAIAARALTLFKTQK